ncbi:MAG: hypothetical protein SFU86_13015 [Pirellulaceae bacterium]|nr:hypothetical protein [Pirellulaceae bacterium]
MKPKFFAAAVALVAAGLSPVAWGVEPAQAFLEGLRARGYHDIALEYLDACAQNPAVPVTFKQTILFEKGVTLVAGARFQRDGTLREKQLDEGQQVLSQFVTNSAGSPLGISARSQLGNVIVERARYKVERAKKATPADKTTLQNDARALYQEAVKVFEELIQEVGQRLQSYPAAMDPKKDEKRIAERDSFRTEYLQAQLLIAATQEEMVETMDKGSKPWTDALNAATAAYKDVYEKYRTRLAGLYARMYQGRCLQKLAKHKEASAIFNELMQNDEKVEEFRTLEFKVMCLAVKSWAAQGLFLETVSKAEPLTLNARPDEDKTDEMMGLRMEVAKACKSYADELAKKNPKDPQIKQLLTIGRKLVTYVTKFTNEYQDEARKLLPEFTGGDAEAIDKKPEPKTFLEARTAAKEAIDAMQTAGLLIKTLPSRIATEKDQAQKAEMEKQLAEAKETAKTGQADALQYCRAALKFVDKETDVNDVNLIRYLLCYLLYSEGNYHDAGVIGEFIAHRYPDSQGARACAKIVMASFLKLYTENQTDNKDFESGKIIGICSYITEKWPNEVEAEEARNTLIPFMIKEKKLKEAQVYLNQIPVDSPHRSGAELKTGQALWASYLENSRQIRDWENGTVQMPEGVDLAARKAELEELKKQAKETLIKGVDGMKARNEASQIMATAVLSLVQIYVDTGEASKAVVLMEEPKIGVLTLVRAKDSTTEKPGFAEETYKTALRAYISSLAEAGTDSSATVAKAKQVMEELKTYMGATSDGATKLVSIYVSLARDLQRQMEIADAGVKVGLGKGFEAFLSQVASEATELNILNWVAETYRGMGESFLTGSKGVAPPEAKGYFDSAVATYQKILDKGTKQPGFLSAPMATQLQLQLARTTRSKGDYVGAMNGFETILKKTPFMLPVQIEAARTYQDWASLVKGTDKITYYRSAMLGARPDKTNPDPAKKGKNVIWGWGEIARITSGKPEYKDQFHEARFNLALCRYNWALSEATPAEKTKTLQYAQRDISITAGLYSDLGGEKWRVQYDTLLKNVQKALGERPLGLSALKVNAEAPAPAASGTTPPPATGTAPKAAATGTPKTTATTAQK